MGKPVILVADDDRLVLATLSDSLRLSGFEVIEARNGQEAVDLARGNCPDIALLDINMPELSGIEAASILKNEFDLYSVFLTAYNEKELVDEAVRKGALGYLVKPLDFKKILPTIETALKRSADLKLLEKSNQDLIGALERNRNISLAIGILMERHTISEEDAFESMRRYARGNRCTLIYVSDELVNLPGENRKLADDIYDQFQKGHS